MSRFGQIFLPLSIGIVLLLAFSLSAQTQEQNVRESKRNPGRPFDLTTSRSPIDISSDTAEGDEKQNLFSFKGNVVAKQDDITLYANMLTIQYDSERKGIKSVVATGNVKMVQQDRRATGQKVTFFQEGNRVVLEGDAVVRDGDNVIRGERVIYYIDEERSVVEGGNNSRVSSTITPSKKE